MRHTLAVFIFLALATVCYSCKKQGSKDECFNGIATIRQLIDRPATIKVTATVHSVYLVEQGAIDTKLIPCNLPMEFMQNDLQVIVSGNVKATPQTAGPCCAENFTITKITR